MNRHSYGLKWEAEELELLAYYRQAIDDPAPVNADAAMPGYVATSLLYKAVSIRFRFPGEPILAKQYLEKASIVANTAVAQNLFQVGRATEVFPFNRACVLRAKILIDGLLYGGPADASVCRMAAQDHADDARQIEPALWEANAQGKYEDGVELLLIAGLRDEAAAMIRSARSMRGKGVKERFTGSKAIVKAGTCPITDPKVRDAYMAMFDAVRDPQFDTRGGCPLTVVEKFSLGVLWDKYFVSTDGTIDWDRALEATRA
jgi:hypothetical protein